MPLITLDLEGTRITINPDRIRGFLANETGRTSMAVRRIAERLVAAAGDRIGDQYSGQHDGEPGREKGLAESGAVEHAGGPHWDAVFHHPIAMIHHEGTTGGFFPLKDPRVRPAAYANEFEGYEFGPTGGPFHHPGTKPNRYLVDAARSIGLTVRKPGAAGRGEVLAARARTSITKEFF